MKKTITIFFVVMLVVLLTSLTYSQSINFTSPANGAVITAFSSETTCQINVQISSSPASNGSTYYYKLFTNNSTYDNQGSHVIPTTFNLSTGAYSFRAELWEINILGQQFKIASSTVNFTVVFPITVNNDFAGGSISIDNSVQGAGAQVNKNVGDILNVGAMDQSDGTYSRVWNTSGTNNSNWQRTPYASSTSQILGASTRNYAYSVQSNDNQATITADLKKNYAISLNEQTEFDGTYSGGVIAHIVDQNSDSVTAPNTLGSSHGSYNFAGWTDDNTLLNPRKLSPTDNTTLTAMYKIPHYSNSQIAFVNNSQRKLVRTPEDNILHLVYESMGHIWYEASSDNGATWQVMNNGRPLDNGGGKLPSIDFIGDWVAIVFQQKYNSSYTIELRAFMGTDLTKPSLSATVYTEYFDDYSVNANPNITWNPLIGNCLVTWERRTNMALDNTYSGINYRYGTLDSNNLTWDSKNISPLDGPDHIPGTDNNSINNSISISKTTDSNYFIFQIAWEQDTWISSGNYWYKNINYCSLKINNDNTQTVSPTSIVSYGNGYLWNIRPSIIAMPYGTARVCWIGDYKGDGTFMVNTLYRDLSNNNNPLYIALGYNVRSASLNMPDYYSTASYISWSTNWGGNSYSDFFADVSNPYNTKTLNTSGQDVQLSNGLNNSSMFVASFYPFTSPYYFKTSSSLGSFPKSNPNSISSGKGVVVAVGNAQFSFSLGDITVDKNKISFVKANDTTNNNFITEPFTLNNNSDFSFSTMEGLVDSVAALTVLSNDSYIDYKAELIEDETNAVIGTLSDIKINSSNLINDNTSSFTVNTDGLGGKTVRIRLSVKTNLFQSKFYTIERYSADGNVVGKSSGEIKEISIQGNEIVKSYGLDQNYPNPFNPTTIITYQIPKDGFVTVKVFDALGREVKTLVNGFKSQGKYSISLDASNLSSGVYFYQLKSGDYSAIKKMVLLK